MEKIQLGKLGEDAAAHFLQSKGYRILDRNYRNRLGEIDIICAKDEYLVFVEVKTRRSEAYGRPIEAVDYRKASRIQNISMCYVSHKKLYGYQPRFDIIEVVKKDCMEIEHVENAF